MTVALCPGSFDPPHRGHIDLLARATRLFSRVVVAVVENPSKNPLFDLDERTRFFRAELGDTVEVVAFRGLLVDEARRLGADVIIKGIRDTADWDYEVKMAHMNRHLSGIDSIYLPTAPEYAFVSSSLVKEVWRLGGDVSALVPDSVQAALQGKEPA